MHFNRADLAAIAIGGAAGASIRHGLAGRNTVDSLLVWDVPELASAFQTDPLLSDGNVLILIYGLPHRTVVVNLLGCLILGCLTAALLRTTSGARRLLVAGATGFCGSLTTFSTFAVDAAELLRGRPDLAARYPSAAESLQPRIGDAIIYLLLSIIGGGLAFWLGRLLTKRIVETHRPSTVGGDV